MYTCKVNLFYLQVAGGLKLQIEANKYIYNPDKSENLQKIHIIDVHKF